MVRIGELNSLKVVRKAEFGYYLDGQTGKTSDDILLPNKSAMGKELSAGEEVEAFIYRDSKDRVIATLKMPLAKVGEIAYLQVVSSTKIGSFVSIGLERDILVPFHEMNYRLIDGNKYLFYVYLDKTNRLAATTDIDEYLTMTDQYGVREEVSGIVYGYQTNGSIMVAVDNKYKAVILKREYFTQIPPGTELKLRVKGFFEDGKMEVTPRKTKIEEIHVLSEFILEYLKEQNGFMPYNDKSTPEEIKRSFECSKNYFKDALGMLMKNNLIKQDEKGTHLL